ncbi:hypothetical protein ABGB16_22390 [Micromonospora sp. B11E3]
MKAAMSTDVTIMIGGRYSTLDTTRLTHDLLAILALDEAASPDGDELVLPYRSAAVRGNPTPVIDLNASMPVVSAPRPELVTARMRSRQ